MHSLQNLQILIDFEVNMGQLADKNGNLLPEVLFKSKGTYLLKITSPSGAFEIRKFVSE